jgi:hypothetical protein
MDLDIHITRAIREWGELVREDAYIEQRGELEPRVQVLLEENTDLRRQLEQEKQRYELALSDSHRRGELLDKADPTAPATMNPQAEMQTPEK